MKGDDRLRITILVQHGLQLADAPLPEPSRKRIWLRVPERGDDPQNYVEMNIF